MIAHRNIETQQKKLSDRAWEELKKSALSYQQALATGCEYLEASEAKKLTGYELPGWIFRYHSPTGEPYRWGSGKWKNRPFCRIKPDWGRASESDREKFGGEDLPKYLSPKKSGNRPYFSKLTNWPAILKKSNIELDFTEGEKKSDCLNAHGFPTIGLSGVTSQRDRHLRDSETFGAGSAWDVEEPEELLRGRFLPELDDGIDYHQRVMGICFDSDITRKRSVQFAIEGLASDLGERGAQPFAIVLPNEIDGTKNGGDDFIYRHGPEVYQVLRENWKAVQGSKDRLLSYDRKTKRYYFTYTEPIPKLKAIMAWAVLKERVAYRPNVGWYEWDGRIWQFLPPEAFDALLQRFCNAQGWLNISPNTIAAIERYVRNEVLTRDEDWNRPTKRAFRNGTYDFERREFLDGWNRGDRLTILHEYDWLAFEVGKCPRWLQFLDEATGDDRPLVDFLQAVLRWVLLPKDRTRKFPVEHLYDFYGNRGTGKGTFLEVLELLAGSSNTATLDQDVLASPVARASLVGKLVAIDRDSQGHWSKATMLNKIASNEPVSTRSLYQNYDPNNRLGVVLVRAYNDFQTVPSGSQGLDRRLIPIRFDAIPKDPDPSLLDRLKGELPHISAWVWSISDAEMFRRLKWGAREVANIRQTSIERFEANNPIFSFLRDEFPTGADWIGASELYERYTDHCKKNGRKGELSSNTFGRILTSWQHFGVNKSKTSDGNFYTLPTPDALMGAGLVPFAAPIAAGGSGGTMEATMEARNADRDGSMQHLEDSPPLPPSKEKNNSDFEGSPPPEASRACTIQTEKGFDASIPASTKEEKPSEPPPKRRRSLPNLRIGDKCRYAGPKNTLGLTCGRKPLKVVAINEAINEEAQTLEVIADGWAMPNTVPLRHLRRI